MLFSNPVNNAEKAIKCKEENVSIIPVAAQKSIIKMEFVCPVKKVISCQDFNALKRNITIPDATFFKTKIIVSIAKTVTTQHKANVF